MKEWEFTYALVDQSDNPVGEINQLGKEGWEVCAYEPKNKDHDGVFYLKRERPVAAVSNLPWWVLDSTMHRRMAGPYHLEEAAKAVRNFMANQRIYELSTLVIGQYRDDENPWLPDDQRKV